MTLTEAWRTLMSLKKRIYAEQTPWRTRGGGMRELSAVLNLQQDDMEENKGNGIKIP